MNATRIPDFTAEAFGMVVLASVTASVIGRALLGDVPFLRLPAFSVHGAHEYLLYAGLGLLAGLVGVGFTRVLYAIEDACDFLWRGPEWLRPAVGGVLLGHVPELSRERQRLEDDEHPEEQHQEHAEAEDGRSVDVHASSIDINLSIVNRYAA